MDARARDGASAALAWLGHPATVLALVVLVVNDHLLKPAIPGPVTGKLSDVAGLVLAPPLVAVLLTLLAPRLPVRAAAAVGLVSVGAGFALVKASGYAAEVASAAWTALAGPSLVRADPTDLLTLPALGLAWWSWTRAHRRPVGVRAVRVVRLVVLLPSAMLAVAATSAVHYPYALGASALDGRPAISIDAGCCDSWPETPAAGRWWVGDAGAGSWRLADKSETARLNDAEPPRCTPEGDRCYRVVAGHLRVEESDDKGRSWRTAWEISDAQREPLARRYPDPGDPDRHFSSRDPVVFATDGGHSVIVANGRDGFAIRHPDGRWERAGWFGLETHDEFPGRHGGAPPELGGSDPTERGTDVLLALALALTLGSGVLVVAVHLAVRRSGGSWVWGVTAALAGTAMAGMLALAWDRTDDLSVPGVVVIFVLPLAALIVSGMLLVAGIRKRGPDGRQRGWDGWWSEMFRAVLVTVVLAGLPLTGWLYAVPPRTWMAVTLAVLATLPGLWLARRAARLADPALTPPADPPYPSVPSGPPSPSGER
ncbi:hypothetical protein [Micromonospora sp. NPDC126480]|uniref:hypothetical protein n=1 Tax=Micromonospora sp. NPDC126480 TaxID=3155312 RepID=UPI00332121ED